MATNSKVFVSPGVYTSEVDLSFVAQSVGVTTLGIVGETLKGPAFEPIFIRNFDEFSTFFGGTTPEKFINTQIPKYEAAYIAKSYLQQSNQLFVTRVLGLSGYDAGPSWSIKTIANVDSSTIAATGTSVDATQINFSAVGDTTGTLFSDYTYAFDSTGIADVDNLIDIPYQLFDGSTSTVREDINNWIFSLVNYVNNGGLATNIPKITYWGSATNATYATLGAYTGETNNFGVPSIPLSGNTLTSPLNDPSGQASGSAGRICTAPS